MPVGIALVGPADKARAQLATYCSEGGFDVFACDDLAIPSSFFAVVVIDEVATPAERARGRVQSWVDKCPTIRIVVITPRPTIWRALVQAQSERLVVLAAPAFGWEIVDALRAPPRDDPPAA